MMQIKKTLLFLSLLFSLSLMCRSPLSGQTESGNTWAGENLTTCRDSAGNTAPVTLGNPEAGYWLKKCCFHWEPATGLSSQNTLYAVANPPNTTTYDLTITCYNFETQIHEYQTVFVDEEIESITATSKQECFNAGEKYTIDQFNIVVSPPVGLDKISFDPPMVPKENETQYFSEVSISIPMCKGSNTVKAQVSVTVINTDYADEWQAAVPTGGINKMVEDVIEKQQKVMEYAQGKFPDLPLEVVGPEFQYEYVQTKLCCPEKSPSIISTDKTAGKVVFGIGRTVSIPFWGFPGAISVDVLFGGSVVAEVGLEYMEKCADNSLIVKLDLKLTVTGGVSIPVGTAVLAANCRLEVEGKAPVFYYQIIPDPKHFIIPEKIVNLNFYLIGEVIFMSATVGQKKWLLKQAQLEL